MYSVDKEEENVSNFNQSIIRILFIIISDPDVGLR